MENNFGRNVMKGQKGIKILAPSPFKIKKEMEKIDPQTQKVIIGKDGKPVTEEKEITIPAFKVDLVFDVSQTEGKEIPRHCRKYADRGRRALQGRFRCP